MRNELPHTKIKMLMSDYTTANLDKKIPSKNKNKQEKQQGVSSQLSYAENPFESATDANPFGNAQNTGNPFVGSGNVQVSQMKPIQMNRKRSNAISIPNGPTSSALIGSTSVEDAHTNTIEGDEPSTFDAGKTAMDTTSSIHGQFSDAKDNAGNAVYAVPDAVKGTVGIASGIFSFASGIKGLMDPDADGFDKAMSAIDVATGAGGVAQTITDLVQGEGGKAAPIIGVVNSGLGLIKNAIGIVKQIKKLKDGVEEGTKANEAISLAGMIIQVGLDVANITKSIYDVVGTAAPGALEAAIPGLGIVMATIDIIQQGVEIAKAVQNFRKMSGFKEELKTNLKGSNPEVFTSEKSGIFGRFRSNDRTVEDKLEQATAVQGEGGDNAREYALAREFKKVNRKRIIRGSINIAADALTIAGDIATLSGIGAGAGVGLKVGAAGVKGGMGLARFLKQKARDKGFGDQNKTSTKKHEKRVQHIKFIYQMIKNLKPYDPEKEAKAIRIKTYIEASGASFKAFIKYTADPQAAANLLYSAMKKREAGDKVSSKK